jgi:hypothetical protein
MAAAKPFGFHVGQNSTQNGAVLDKLPLGCGKLIGTAKVGLNVGDQPLGLAVGAGAAVDTFKRKEARLPVDSMIFIVALPLSMRKGASVAIK